MGGIINYEWNFDVERVVTAVPEPGTLSLFAAGLLTLGLMRRKVAAQQSR
jgi:hypothetical protein